MGQQLALIELPPPPPPAPPSVLTTGEAPPTTSTEIGLWWNAVLVVVQEGRRLRLRWRDERVWLGADARDLNVYGPRVGREPGAVYVAELLTLVAPERPIERYYRAYNVRRVLGEAPPVAEGP